MQMTNEEIVRDCTQAANKSKQIKILAELNAVSPSEIRAVLAQAGVEGVNMPTRIKQSKPDVEVQEVNQTIYERIEMILGALPEDASKCTREAAGNLVIAVFKDYVQQWLRTEGKMDRVELIEALYHMSPETGSFCCLGCGYEHGCSVHGCAVIRAAATEIEALAAENSALRAPLVCREEDASA